MAADNSTKIIISAEDKASAALSSISAQVGNLQAALGSLGGTLGATLTVGGFAALVKGAIDAADQMNDLSQRVGIAVKDLGTWKLAAESSGASMESIAKGVKGLSAYMHDHAKELKAAGITATDTAGAMTQLADIFKAMPDGVEKTALAVKLFGKSGMDLIPMLNMGSEGLAEMRAKSAEYSRQLAILAPQADKFNDELAVLALNSKATGMNIANHLIGPMTELVKAFGDLAAGGDRAWGVMQRLADAKHPIAQSLLAWRSVLSPEAGRSANGWELAGMDPKTGRALATGGMMLPGANSPAEIEAMRKAAILNPVAAAAARGRMFDENDVLYNIEEAVRKQQRAAIIKDQADEEKALAEAIKESNKAIADHANALGKDVAAAERALETWGLTESQIADLTLARLKHAKAMEAEADADEATLAYYDREIEALERIRAAKFAIEAKETAKKEAEDAAKAWQEFARDLESSLTDALMRSFESGDSFGQSFVNNLRNLIKTAALKFSVQMVVGSAAGAASNALGINLGGGSSGGGGIGGLISNGSSIYNLASGGGLMGSFGLGASSAASELALGASFVGPSASLAGGAIGAGASAGLATGSAAAAEGMASIAAAAPYIGAALAVASIFGGSLFGKKKPAPIEWGIVDMPLNGSTPEHHGVPSAVTATGPFTMIGAPGQHLKRNGMSYAQLKAQVADPLAQLDTLLAGYLSSGEISTVSRALITGNEGEHGWGQKDAVMMRRLNRISDALGGWIDKAFDTTSGNLQKRYQELAQILSIRGNEAVEKLAKGMLNATGKWSYEKFAALQSKVDAFNNSFKTEAERFADYSKAMHAAFEKMNLAFPTTRDGYKKLVEGIDTSTKAGFEMYVTLLDLAPTMDAYYQALQNELDVKSKLVAMNDSNFANVVDFTRYQRVAANYDSAFASDYAYNIGTGAIHPGAAGGDLVAEIRALRAEVQAGNIAVAVATQETAKTLRRWNGDGMPDVRVVA